LASRDQADSPFHQTTYDFPHPTSPTSFVPTRRISFTDDISISTPATREGHVVQDTQLLLRAMQPAVVDSPSSMITNESLILDIKPTKAIAETVTQTRSTNLRQQLVNKKIERMELVDNYNGPPSHGDSRKSVKSLYTSKNSILNEE
jgi:hypothetical protein